MFLIAWLWNPWKEYENTRHNAGFIAVDYIRHQRWLPQRTNEKKWHAKVSKGTQLKNNIILVKPQSYMNKSWWPISQILNFFKIPTSNLLILHDEIDFSTGKIKYKKGWSHAGNNGLRDIIDTLGTKEFARIRIGIDKPQNKKDIVQHVLSNFSVAENKIMQTQMPIIQEKIETWISQNDNTTKQAKIAI